jgi:hypothetical protein
MTALLVDHRDDQTVMTRLLVDVLVYKQMGKCWGLSTSVPKKVKPLPKVRHTHTHPSHTLSQTYTHTCTQCRVRACARARTHAREG